MRTEYINIKSEPTIWSVGTDSKTDHAKGEFKNVLKESMENLKQLHAIDEKNTELLATGRADNLHKIMIDSEKADIALQLTLQVRNKAMEAYQEMMRMQI